MLEFARERVHARVAARGRCVSRLLARASMSAARMDERLRAFARWSVSVHSEGAFKKVSRRVLMLRRASAPSLISN